MWQVLCQVRRMGCIIIPANRPPCTLLSGRCRAFVFMSQRTLPLRYTDLCPQRHSNHQLHNQRFYHPCHADVGRFERHTLLTTEACGRCRDSCSVLLWRVSQILWQTAVLTRLAVFESLLVCFLVRFATFRSRATQLNLP